MNAGLTGERDLVWCFENETLVCFYKLFLVWLLRKCHVRRKIKTISFIGSRDKLMFPDNHKTYPGHKFIQVLQVTLVIAIGVFGIMGLTRPRSSSPAATAVPPISEAAPIDVPLLIEAAPTVGPDNLALTLYDQAAEAHDLDNYDQAIELYTQVLELDPRMTNAWLGRAVAYEHTDANERLSDNDFWRYLRSLETERIEREIVINESLELEMTEGRVYALSFEVQSGDQLRVAASSVENGEPGDEDVVDPLVLLFEPGGDLVQANDDTLRKDGSLINMNSRIDDYAVMQDGTYTLLLSHAGGGSAGMINMKVSVR